MIANLLECSFNFILNKYINTVVFISTVKNSRNLIKHHKITDNKCLEEREYLHKWKKITSLVEPFSFRLYSKFCKKSPNIVPEFIFGNIIQPILSPVKYHSFYTDKNLYKSYLGNCSPKILLCRINNGTFLNGELEPSTGSLLDIASPTNQLILKPSYGSYGGYGVIKFLYKDGKWISHDDSIILTEDFLKNYGPNWSLQEGIRQHPFLSQFNQSSVQTFRICTYKSIKDDKVHIPSAVMRIGNKGSVVDNGTSGGVFVGINVETGDLGKYISDKKGNISNMWNGIDFQNSNFTIPQWDEIKSFTKLLASKIPHLRSLGFDITLDYNGNPVMIEFNPGNFSPWLFQFSGQPIFGEWTDEIIDYCKSKL